MTQRSRSPTTPPPGQEITYEKILTETPIETEKLIDQRTGAVIRQTEKRGTPRITRTKITKGVKINIARCEGPSGKPMLHFRLLPNRKSAQEAAREAGRGNPPVHHTAHGPGQRPHFHPADRYGNIIKDGAHYEYPAPKHFLISDKKT
ncbi:unnamed protein product [Rotaria sordida]|uniref:Uncharacterized protein n=1 Tax=Rotaria sordida TaxID=392033 RepID=A0A816CGZ6_9BILA|nr:unnamed protein product [Rotaria sordida]CAF1622621.1 unnamed protein product [Rotaria sordida]